MHFKKLVLRFFEDFNQLIRSTQFLQRHRLNQKFFTRSRKLDFAGIICFLLRIPQKTLSSEMADYVSQFLGSTNIQRISKQAFSSARQKISPSAFQELLDFSYQHLHPFCANPIFWYGYAVKASKINEAETTITIENAKFWIDSDDKVRQIGVMGDFQGKYRDIIGIGSTLEDVKKNIGNYNEEYDTYGIENEKGICFELGDMEEYDDYWDELKAPIEIIFAY